MATEEHDSESQRLAAVERLSGLGLLELNITTGAATWTPGARRLLPGLDASGQGAWRDIASQVARADRPAFFGVLRPALTVPVEPIQLEGVVRSRDGEWLEWSAETQSSDDGPWRATVTLRNVTQSRRLERDLWNEAHGAKQLMDLAAIGVWSVDIASGQLYWSDEVFRIHELPIGEPPSVAEAIGYYPDESAQAVERGLQRAIAGEGPYDLELPLVTAEDRTIWVQVRGGVERSADGEPTRIFGIIRDVTTRHQAEELVRTSEERLQLALEGAGDGVWDWNLETDQVYFSKRYKAILGYAEHEIEHSLSEWAARVPEEDREAAMTAVDRCIRGETPDYRAEFRMLHKDGSWRWILARAQVLSRDGSGIAQRMIGTHTDITEQVQLRRELVDAKESAEATARAKSEFLATMSHEIRTPMNGVLGLARVLMDTKLNAEQHRFAHSIHSSGTSLLGILNDILDLSKAEAGMLTLESIPMDPVRCAEEVLELQRVAASLKPDLELGLEVGDNVPRSIVGDPGRMRQILLNLVGNAIKFTAEGRVDVRLSTSEDAEGVRRLRIAVLDTGIGIDPATRASLFDAFTQGDTSTTRRFGGTGLGLSICKHLAERMNGQLDCSSNGGHGSVFWIEIPVVSTSEAPGGERDAEGATIDGKGANVLVVEDNLVNQLVARKMLEHLGFRVTVVADGQEALEATEFEDFAIVFMDCQMPVMDGYECTRKIRARASSRRSSRTPIIAMTASALEGDRARCLAAGMDDYVAKPIIHTDLVLALRRALDPQTRRQRASQRQASAG